MIIHRYKYPQYTIGQSHDVEDVNIYFMSASMLATLYKQTLHEQISQTDV